MQNVLKSSRKGFIKKCHAVEGGTVKADDVLIEFENIIDQHNKSL
jgi:biotin carboxyl carrier protein